MEHLILQTPDGFNLDTLFLKGANDIGIVFCHGLRWYKEGEKPFMNAAQKLNQKGFSILLFDFRGHGKSSGDSAEDFTITGQLTDIDCAVQFLKENGVEKIYLAGASFGAGATALYAVQHPEITKLFLSNPQLNYSHTLEKHFLPQLVLLEKQSYIESGSRKFKLGKKLFDEMQHFTPYKELEKYMGELLIVHGDSDQRIPHSEVVEIFEKLNNQKKKFSLVIGADHGFHEEPYTSQVTEQIIQFFSS